MPEITHQAAMSPPIVPAPITCTRLRFGDVLRRFVLQHLGEAEDAAQIARCLAHHERREKAGLGDRHLPPVAAEAIEQVDELEGRGIVVFAHLLGGFLAHPVGQRSANRRLAQQPLPPGRALGFALLQALPGGLPSAIPACLARADRRGPWRAPHWGAASCRPAWRA